MSLLLGLVTLALVWWALTAYAKADPRKLVSTMRKIGGGLAFAGAALLLVRGRIDMAMALGWVGLWLFGLGTFGLSSPWQRTTKSPGAKSRVRSATIEMELDHDTGALAGRMLTGAEAGAELDGLDREALLDLLRRCLTEDADGARLLEAYLDRRFAGWRENAERDPDPRARDEPRTGPMTQEEAYDILGLPPGANGDDIRRAHRALMKKLHPDQGGSTYLAARVNQAKDVLLARHR